MSGKLVGSILVIIALIAGVALYYLQVYHFYETVEVTGEDDVQLTSLVSGQPETVPYSDFEAIDATSSPIRYRSCFTTPMSLALATETYVAYDRAEPLEAPGWFDCFNADALGAALQDGTALAFLGTENITYGIDRIIALTDDGRGYAWHQINPCGEKLFDGEPLPDDCPPPPERTQ